MDVLAFMLKILVLGISHAVPVIFQRFSSLLPTVVSCIVLEIASAGGVLVPFQAADGIVPFESPVDVSTAAVLVLLEILSNYSADVVLLPGYKAVSDGFQILGVLFLPMEQLLHMEVEVIV